MNQRIHDYAVIGDCRSAALISRAGSIDWLCWPRFDSPSIFGGLLDPNGGRWRIGPPGQPVAKREYIPDTNVLRSRFRTGDGVLSLTDFMPAASEEKKREVMLPDHEIIRIAECESGEVDVEMILEPKPGYGLAQGKFRQAGALGLRIEIPSGLLALQTDMPIKQNGDRFLGRKRLSKGQKLYFSLTFADDWPAVFPPLGHWTETALSRTVKWWREWMQRFDYDGPGRPMVERSVLALKLLIYAPSGAIVASPTMSLPERLGGDLNWDYRYCWLRDASLTARALFGVGIKEEARAFVSWLLQSTRLTRPELRILYDMHGNVPPAERPLKHWAGYRNSRPVRVGNAAVNQLQLDVYGEVIEAVSHFLLNGGVLDRETQRMLCGFGDYVCKNWNKPDEGIWEPRSGRAHHTHSLALCWTALDRLVELHRKDHLFSKNVTGLVRKRDLIRKEIETKAWNESLSSYAAVLGGDYVDASSLLLPWFGFEAASEPRMRQTHARIKERLGAGDGLLYRYRTADSPGEGAFGICSFWNAEYLALGGGTIDEARDAFEMVLQCGNDVGLFGEEIDPRTKEALGNFPQGFTHIGLINAAVTLTRRMRGEQPVQRRIPAGGRKAETRA